MVSKFISRGGMFESRVNYQNSSQDLTSASYTNITLMLFLASNFFVKSSPLVLFLFFS